MNNRAARSIRKVLDLPRLPKSMNALEREQYRQAKRTYNALPAPERSTFLDDVTKLKRVFADKLAAQNAR